MVHEVAAAGFGAEAEAYERARPTYPPEVVAWITEGLGPAARVVDLAAGTGKLTRLLSGHSIVAVEPVAAMREGLRRAVPGIPLVSGVAEALPFARESIDLVTVGQAFHWFDAAAALSEARRVLRMGGRLALVWNARDRSVDWVDRVWSVMDRVERAAPWRDHDREAGDPHAWRAETLGGAPGFGPVEQATFGNEQVLGPEGVVERVKAVSHVAVLPPAEQAVVLDEVRRTLSSHPDTRGRDRLVIPYRVDTYRAGRTA